MNTILEIGIIQCLLLVVLAFQKKQKQLPNKILIIWLILFCLHLSLILLVQLGFSNKFILILAKVFVLNHGPLLFLYAISVFKGKLRFKEFAHFIPFTFALIFGLSVTENSILIWKYTLLAAKITSLIFYSVYTFYWVSLQTRLLKKESAEDFSHEIMWIKIVASLLLINIGIGILHILSNVLFEQSFYAFLDILIYVAMIIVIGYFGLKQGVLFKVESPQKEKKESYVHSPLKNENISQLSAAIKHFFEHEKIYLESDFSLETLSKKLSVPKHHLSQIINSEMNTTFYDLVNSKRINRVIEMLKNNEDVNSTLEGLGYSAGFKTKSSFFYNFKKYTGQTPKQFKQKMSTD